MLSYVPRRARYTVPLLRLMWSRVISARRCRFGTKRSPSRWIQRTGIDRPLPILLV
jgi:hypothetical protein